MCGLPTETDEDVLQIADLADEGDRARAARSPASSDIRCTVSIGGFVPKPHTPFQWAAQLDHETTDARLEKLRDAIRADKQYGRAIGFRYHDGKPGHHRGPALPRRPPGRRGHPARSGSDGGRFDGWSEHFSYDRWMAAADTALAGTGVDLDWYTTRERDYDEVLPVGPPRLRARQGLALGGLAGRRSPEVEVEDCRWTPCYDCGVCPQMDTEIQIGPTGVKLLPLEVAGAKGCARQ